MKVLAGSLRHPGSVPRLPRGLLVWALTALAAVAPGCQRHEELKTVYGHRRGEGALSVNGTSVLAGMWEHQGARVRTRTRLTQDLDRFQVVVWFPDDFQLPDAETCEFLDQWLAGKPGRTLVYVGRDFDAEPHYWKQTARESPAAERLQLLRRAGRARSEHVSQRQRMPPEAVCRWFSVRRDAPYRQLKELAGPWAERVRDERTRIWIEGRLQAPSGDEPSPAESASDRGEGQPHVPADQQPEQPEQAQAGDHGQLVHEVLLRSGSTALVLSIRKPAWGDSKILAVCNGSFLLNARLVNHAHRKLAGQLIRASGGGDQSVAFLQSGPGGPSIRSGTTVEPSQGDLRRAVLVLHWMLLGLLFCLAVFPIFGRPRSPRPESTADFGQHVEALGRLLEKSGNLQYARQLLDDYRSTAYRESGARHAGPATPGKPVAQRAPPAGRPRPAGKPPTGRGPRTET